MRLKIQGLLLMFNFKLFISAKTQVSREDSEKEVCLPYSAKVNCSYLPIEFLDCDELVDNKGNVTLHAERGHGCLYFGGQRYEDVEIAKTRCRVMVGIQCCGEREFLKDGFPCLKYNNHYFVTTLIYSILLGFLGMDRFCLGHVGTAVGKLLTLGGVGVWWIVDIILLISGSLLPKDGSNWNYNV